MNVPAPYLTQPNYINAMASGLNTSLGFAKLHPSRIIVKGNSNEAPIKREPGAPFSPERRAYEDTVKQQIELNKQNVIKTQLENQKRQNELEDSKIARTTKGLQTAASYAPQITPVNYYDWYNWVNESKFVPYDMFPSPDEVAKYTPDQFAALTDNISKLQSPKLSVVKAAAKAYDQQIKDQAKIAKLNNETTTLKLKNIKDAIAAQNKYLELNRKYSAVGNKASTAEDKKTSTIQKRLSDISEKFYKTDSNGTVPFIQSDKNGGSALAAEFNEKAKKINSPLRIVWKPNTEKTAGWVGFGNGPLGIPIGEKPADGGLYTLIDTSNGEESNIDQQSLPTKTEKPKTKKPKVYHFSLEKGLYKEEPKAKPTTVYHYSLKNGWSE